MEKKRLIVTLTKDEYNQIAEEARLYGRTIANHVRYQFDIPEVRQGIRRPEPQPKKRSRRAGDKPKG